MKRNILLGSFFAFISHLYTHEGRINAIISDAAVDFPILCQILQEESLPEAVDKGVIRVVGALADRIYRQEIRSLLGPCNVILSHDIVERGQAFSHIINIDAPTISHLLSFPQLQQRSILREARTRVNNKVHSFLETQPYRDHQLAADALPLDNFLNNL